MVINLIKPKRMFSLTLPNKVKGQYWVTDIDDNGKVRDLISIEAIHGEWVVKSNKLVSVLNSKNECVENAVLNPSSFFNLRIAGSDERVILFAESVDESRQTFKKFVIKTPDNISVGRMPGNNLCFENKYVSGQHATVSYDGNNWLIVDPGSTNGTYVNGYRVTSRSLNAGDFIYIMGLIIVIGHNYLAINNPDGLLKINTRSFAEYHPQNIDDSKEEFTLPDKEFFFRSPRFSRAIEHAQITIDPPPQIQKAETVPLALMLGPSLTMGMTSLSTGILSVTNVINNGGNISQALPTMMMSVGMLLGTVLWPILTKKYEKKEKVKNEAKRQKLYLAYLDSVRDEIKRKCKEQSDILNENLVTLDECANRIAESKVGLWERSPGQSDFLHIRLGVGDLPLDAEVKFPEKKFSMENDTLQDAMLSLGAEPKLLNNIPISISLTDYTTVGVYGEKAAAFNMLKVMLLQLMALHSYDEVTVKMITDKSNEEEWNFIRWIPHLWNNEKTVRFFATSADEVKELSSIIEKNILSREDNSNNDDYTDYAPYYVIFSTSKDLFKKCEAAQRLLNYKNNRGFSIILAAPQLKDFPKETKLVVALENANSKVFVKDDTSGKYTQFNADLLNEAALDYLSRDLANIELDLGGQGYSLPNMVTFLEMFHVGKIEHLNSLTRWKDNNPTITLQTPVGVDSHGELFNLDLHEKYHGPHGLVAGMTGSGKSEFIITYILSLAVNYHPDEVAFILIDYKGGGLTGAFEDDERGIKLPHLAGTITNLDGAAVKRSLISIQSELRRRQAIFNEARKVSNEGTMDIYKYQQLYRDKVVSEPLPHLFIISDEFAELKTQQPEFMEQLISAARIGRSLGVHLILATQKPSGVVDDQIWSNSKFRVCLKVQEKADSQDMIKCPDAAELSQTGRFYLQVGFNELFALGQSAWCGAEYIPTETVEKNVDSSIQVVDNLGRVLMSVKPNKKKDFTGKKIKQIVAIVKYLSDLATEENISIRPLWLDPIPAKIFVGDLENKYSNHSEKTVLEPIVGEYDDPFNQRQGVLTVPFSKEGNCLIYGSTGNGKATFLTTLCYSLLKNHNSDELNLYIMDFGSETLKSFEKAPQVGGVVTSNDDEKVLNLFKMLQREMENRKVLFSEYGGDYGNYCKNSDKQLPNIVVIMNNYSAFAEQYEDYVEAFSLLTRECVKYGIYFAVTVNSANGIRYKTAQNFKIVFTMQLNDASDYQMIVGKTDGLIPSKYKGRGLVALDRVYEFQTAYCSDTDEPQEFIRGFCSSLNESGATRAKRIPVLPDRVDFAYIKDEMAGLHQVPVGVSKKSLYIMKADFRNRVVYPVLSQELYVTAPFVNELKKVLKAITEIKIIDSEQVLSSRQEGDEWIRKADYESFVVDLFNDMVERNNTYKDSKLDATSLDKFEEKTYIIVGLKRFYDMLSDDGKEKFSVLLEKAETFYKLHFVIVESVSQLNPFNYEAWYKRQIQGTDGLWIGDGVADQYVLKISKVTNDLYEEIGSDYGYIFQKGRLTLLKLLSDSETEGE